MLRFKHTIKPALVLTLTSILTGCAAPARIDQIAANKVYSNQAASELRGNIGNIEVTGGTDTNPMWASKVSSSAFQRALEESLKAAGLFNTFGASSRYQLTADLLNLDQPVFGLDMTVSSNVRYSLVERTSRKEIFSKVIQANYVAKFSDAFAAAQRLQLANEGSIRANIVALIEELNQVKP
jgi:hypothetical protein